MDMSLQSSKKSVSFADSTFNSIDYKAEVNLLVVFLNSWDERKIEVRFEGVLQFFYQISDDIQDMYEVVGSSKILENAVKRAYEIVPDAHPYKLIVIKDIDDDIVLEVVCVNYFIFKDGLMT
ncbi:MAG: hypothetical protein K0S07_762 [Chlamydiales bacterium]|jgi:hypothetical protein|nr:hypothetical protein [Chlamydiales bacterium]